MKPIGPAAVRAWVEQNDTSAHALGVALGSTDGQVAKWINGNRPTLALRWKVAIARHTGLRLDRVVDGDELETARELFAVFARDASGNGVPA